MPLILKKSRRESRIERCNMGSRSWESVFTSYKGCKRVSCVVAAGDCLYVLGGKTELQREVGRRNLSRKGEFVTKAERFDAVHSKWEEIADMQQERGCAFGVATQGNIFVAEGQGAEKKTIEFM